MRQLEILQAQSDLNHDVGLQETEKEILEMLKKWSLIDMSILKQKSRITWLSHGDNNSKFYFTTMKVRNAINKIDMLHNSQGDIFTDPMEIGEEIKSFYLKLLGTNNFDCIKAIDIDMVRKGPRLTQQVCSLLT